jgi:hypothetical protein
MEFQYRYVRTIKCYPVPEIRAMICLRNFINLMKLRVGLIHYPFAIKGIVSRKFWCRWIDKYFLRLFYFISFLKCHRFHLEFFDI